MTTWLRAAGLAPRVLSDGGIPVAVVCDIHGERPGPRYLLDACLDTAGYGDETAWTRPPLSAEVADGWMHGRGTSDSKVAVATFCHIAARLAAAPAALAGTLTLLFDLDEHTGGFAGIRTYLAQVPHDDPVRGAFIGYPGPDTIVIGGRGFYRATITMFGQADHSASRKTRTANAIVKASHLVTSLAGGDLHQVPDLHGFGVPPKATVTSVVGGAAGTFSVVPDRCEVQVDVRLTPSFTRDDARELLRTLTAECDQRHPAPRRSRVDEAIESWPPFKLPEDHELPTTLRHAARAAGLDPVLVVAGPSNIGNLLASRGIPATAGFGVAYRGLHGTDETIDLATIAPVQAAYHRAVLHLLSPTQPGN
ncbi:MAG: M20 family metallopeptidase [Kineosporiaceae bacterium]